MAALLAGGSLLSAAFGAPALDWQPGLAGREPWRAWSAAFVHFSALHLAANVAGAVLVGAFGWAARVPWRVTVAWFVAWPLTQLGLLARPDLLDYGGLSGVLHAGIVVAALYVLIAGRGPRRAIGAATLLVVAIKVASESPWGTALRHPAGWDIAVAPFAHLSGAVAGLLTGALALAGPRRSHSIDADD